MRCHEAPLAPRVMFCHVLSWSTAIRSSHRARPNEGPPGVLGARGSPVRFLSLMLERPLRQALPSCPDAPLRHARNKSGHDGEGAGMTGTGPGRRTSIRVPVPMPPPKLCGSVPAYRSLRRVPFRSLPSAPPPGRRQAAGPFTARICVRARARVGAGAVRAPDCPREAAAGRASPAVLPLRHARTPPSSYPDLFRVSPPPPPLPPAGRMDTRNKSGYDGSRGGMTGRGPGQRKGSGAAGTSPEMSCDVMFAMPSPMLCRSVPAYRSSFSVPSARRRPGGRDPVSRVSRAGAGACRRRRRHAPAPARARGKRKAHLARCLNRGLFRAGANGETKRTRGCRFLLPAQSSGCLENFNPFVELFL